MGSRALLSPMIISSALPPHRRVLCQVLACWWREGSMCAPADQLLATRPHVSMRRPGVIAVGVRPTIITTANPQGPRAVSRCLCFAQYYRPTAPSWAAQWACGSSQLEFDQHITTASPQSPRAETHYFCAIDQRSHFCLHCDPSQRRHTSSLPLPKKKRMRGFGVPGHATHEKTVHVPVSFAPLSLPCLDSFPDPYFGPPTTAESPLST